jgi:hypothetical protein
VIIMAISCTGTTEKMILWQSLNIDVSRDNHGQASASTTLINTSYFPGASSMINRGVLRRMRRPPMIRFRLGCSLPHAGRPR